MPKDKPAPQISAKEIRLKVPREDTGMRLDQFIGKAAPELSRRKARTVLQIGGVFVDGKRTKVASKPVQTGMSIKVFVGGALQRAHGSAAKEHAPPPPLPVVYEDEDIVVVDKPAGLLTCPSPESDRNNVLDMLTRGLALGDDKARGSMFVVHRIDLQTSGLLVFAKNEAANKALCERFRIHDIGRRYVTVVHGAFPVNTHQLNTMVSGKTARTDVVSRAVLAGGAMTQLEVELHTGRTHQIRIHCGDAGHAVCGDPRRRRTPNLRGGPPRPPRMALHAAHLSFAHPRDERTMTFDSPLPPDLADWLVAVSDTDIS